jgi:hypothetical protein
MNSALRILREELSWLEAARYNAVKELSNERVPVGMAQTLLDRLDLEMLEIEAAIEHLVGRLPRLRTVGARPQLELFE